MEEKRRPLIVIAGPTASGKTALSVRLARLIGGEIISADSMQVYRGMDIGSAKITAEEMQGIPHHLIDILDPREEFSAAVFKERAAKAEWEIAARGRIPIVAGGTGFYIQALLYDVNFAGNQEDTAYRERLERLAREEGPGKLHQLLCQVDPESAAAIHANNVKRVIRALEFYRQTGQKISRHNREERERTSPWQFFYYVLTMDRQILYERIERRVDAMIEAGLVEEVRRLKAMGLDRSMVSMQGLGYKEILAFLEGEMSLQEAVYTIKRDTRHFAKRQLTWFKREREVRWLDLDRLGGPEGALALILEQLKEEAGIEAREM